MSCFPAVLTPQSLICRALLLIASSNLIYSCWIDFQSGRKWGGNLIWRLSGSGKIGLRRSRGSTQGASPARISIRYLSQRKRRLAYLGEGEARRYCPFTDSMRLCSWIAMSWEIYQATKGLTVWLRSHQAPSLNWQLLATLIVTSYDWGKTHSSNLGWGWGEGVHFLLILFLSILCYYVPGWSWTFGWLAIIFAVKRPSSVISSNKLYLVSGWQNHDLPPPPHMTFLHHLPIKLTVDSPRLGKKIEQRW